MLKAKFHCVNGGLQLIIVAVMNTNLLTHPPVDSIELSKSFLAEGAVIQTEADNFRVFIGPFEPCSLENLKSLSPKQSIFYTTDFWQFLKGDQNQTEYYLPKYSFSLTRTQFLQFLALAANKNGTNSSLEAIDWTMASMVDFRQQYDWIQEQIAQGALSKALPIALQKGSGYVPSRLPQILDQIVNNPSQNFAYGFWRGNAGLAGYTPEVLSHWQADQGTLQTMALAGTWRKNSTPDFEDAKIKQEHNYVIQDIETQLKSFPLLEKSKTQVVELPHLFHLKTHFIYECQSLSDYMKAIRLLHPTAALGLFPRQLSAIEEFAQFDLQKKRKQFGAPIGFMTANEGFMLVGIRNVMWSQNQVELFAGCGVTKDSVFEDEWNEILAKQESVKKMLGLEN